MSYFYYISNIPFRDFERNSGTNRHTVSAKLKMWLCLWLLQSTIGVNLPRQFPQPYYKIMSAMVWVTSNADCKSKLPTQFPIYFYD